MKPVDVKSNTYINSSKEISDKDPKSLVKKLMIKILNLKLMILLEYQKIKTF